MTLYRGMSWTDGKLIHFKWLLLISFLVKWFPNIFLSYWLGYRWKSNKKQSAWTKGYICWQLERDFYEAPWFSVQNTLFLLYLDNFKSFSTVRNWFKRQLGSSASGNLQHMSEIFSPTSPNLYNFCNKLDLSYNPNSLQTWTKSVSEKQPVCVKHPN